MAFKVIITVTELIFLGMNMFLAFLILRRAKNIFMPANVNSIVILNIVKIFFRFQKVHKYSNEMMFVMSL